MSNLCNIELIPPEHRTLGTAVIGQSGFGKTSLLHSMIGDDLYHRRKVIVVDPHGDLSEILLLQEAQMGVEYSRSLGRNPPLIIPNAVARQLFKAENFPPTDRVEGLNLYECPDPGDPLALDRTVDGVVQVFKRLWGDERQFYPRIEYVLRNTARVISANPGATMADIPRLFPNLTLRTKLLRRVHNQGVRDFFADYDSRTSFKKIELIESTLNKLDQFLGSEALYGMVRHPRTTYQLEEFLTDPTPGLMLVTLPIGILGEGVSEFIGSVFLSLLQQQVLARIKQKTRPRVHLYIDEFHRFTTPAVTSLLTEGRKFEVATTVALQSLEQVREGRDRTAVLSAGNLIVFQVEGKTDADVLASQLKITPKPTGEERPVMRTQPHYEMQILWDSEENQRLYEQGRKHYEDTVDYFNSLVSDTKREELEKHRAHEVMIKAEEQLTSYWNPFRDEHYRSVEVYVGEEPVRADEQNGRYDKGETIYDMVPALQTMSDAKAELVNLLATLPKYSAYVQSPGVEEGVVALKSSIDRLLKLKNYPGWQQKIQDLLDHSALETGDAPAAKPVREPEPEAEVIVLREEAPAIGNVRMRRSREV